MGIVTDTSEKKRPNADLWVGVGMVAASLLGFLVTFFEIQEVMVLPRIVFSVSTAMGILLMVSSRRIGKIHPKKVQKEELVISLILLMMVLLFPLLGFYTTYFLAMTAFSFLFVPIVGRKGKVKLLLVLTISLFVVYLLFGVLLGIKMPRGVLI